MTPAGTLTTNAERARGLAAWLFGLGLGSYMFLSAQTLLAIGIPYDAPWGPMPAKIHPGTYLILAAYAVVLASHGHPLRVLIGQLRQQPLPAAFLFSSIYLLAYSVLRYGPSGAAFVIDTLIMAPICALTMLSFDQRRQRLFLWMIGFFLVANSLLALGESALQQRLIPLRLGGKPEMPEEFFRASAFLGHPLMNAQTTVALLPIVLLLPVARWLKHLMVLALVLSVLAYGGRTAFVVATSVYGTYLCGLVVLGLMQGRISYLQLTGGSVGVGLVVAGVVAGVAASGLGERIFKSLVWDNSASVRARVWDIFDYLHLEDLVFGVSPDAMSGLMVRIGLFAPTEAIENFWLVLLTQFGLAGFVPFLVGFGCLFLYLWRRAFGSMRVALAVFLAVASTTNSLASKTVGLCLLTCAVTAAAPLRPRPRPAPLAWPGTWAEARP